MVICVFSCNFTSVAAAADLLCASCFCVSSVVASDGTVETNTVNAARPLLLLLGPRRGINKSTTEKGQKKGPLDFTPPGFEARIRRWASE